MTNGREQMDRLLKQIEQEAYARGWADAIAALQAKAAELPVAESAPRTNGAPHVVERGRGRPATTIGSVRDAIFEKPGMKGVELVRFLEQRGTPVLERTVRSCLRRLKNRDARLRRQRWYPIEASENQNGEALIGPPH